MMGPVKLILATRNRHKLEEIRTLFDLPGLDLSSALDHPDIPDVEEDGKTFEENAVKKAVALARATGGWALADDSGLEVDALGGAPGVYSARYAGEPVSYPANNAKLLNACMARTTAGRGSVAWSRCRVPQAGPARWMGAAKDGSFMRYAAHRALVTIRCLCPTAGRRRLPRWKRPRNTRSRIAAARCRKPARRGMIY